MFGNWYLLLVTLFVAEGANIGRFWHITDHHWDPYYSQNATEPMKICPSSYGRHIPDAGPLGDYKCDAPWTLIQSFIHAMKRIYPDPDFILWTGDDTLHTGEQDFYLGKEKVIDIIGNVSGAIRGVFPETPIFPALGNHDYHPKSQIPPGGSDILTAIADMWRPWFSDTAYDTFKREGFYKEYLPGSTQHIMMILNSNFWYDSNKAVNGSGDPGMEFQWMESTLQEAAANSHKVYIAGHVPPGYFEMPSDYRKRWFYNHYNLRFLQIIREHKDVIAGMFFGHHHSDTFRIIKDSAGSVAQCVLIAPGVTPWATTLGGVVNGSNNPGIRLIEYDKDTLHLRDYSQYYLDLAAANQESQTDPSSLWKHEYNATSTYNITDITPQSWEQLASTMRKGCESNGSACPSAFTAYHKMTSVSYDTGACEVRCQKFQLCAITEADTEGYESCMDNWGNHGERMQSSNWAGWIILIASILHTSLSFIANIST